jgi:hypothetical protein
MNWKGCGRKRSWPSATYCAGIRLEELTKPWKPSVKTVDIPTENQTVHLPNIRQKHHHITQLACWPHSSPDSGRDSARQADNDISEELKAAGPLRTGSCIPWPATTVTLSIRFWGPSACLSGKLLLALASTVILGSESRGTHEHISRFLETCNLLTSVIEASCVFFVLQFIMGCLDPSVCGMQQQLTISNLSLPGMSVLGIHMYWACRYIT